MLPLRSAQAVGAFWGGVVALLPTPARRIARINLDLCMPEIGVQARHRLARRSLTEAGRMAAESGPLWTWPRERVLALVREVQGGQCLQEGLGAGKGVLLAAPHLGAWEIVGLWCASRFPMVTLYRAPRQPGIDRFLRGARERFGGRHLPASLGAVRTLEKALRKGELVGILPDQDPGEGWGVFAPFFGVPANTPVLIPRLVSRTGARVVLGWAERLPRGGGYRLRFRPASPGLDSDDIVEAASALNRDIEACVREMPGQYLWSYSRFRIPPPGGRNPYRRE